MLFINAGVPINVGASKPFIFFGLMAYRRVAIIPALCSLPRRTCLEFAELKRVLSPSPRCSGLGLQPVEWAEIMKGLAGKGGAKG